MARLPQGEGERQDGKTVEKQMVPQLSLSLGREAGGGGGWEETVQGQPGSTDS